MIDLQKHPSAMWTDSKSQCAQTITSRRITHSECTESHAIRPFSNGRGSGALTTVKQVLSSFEAEGFKSDDDDEFSSTTWSDKPLFDDEEKKPEPADQEMPPRATLHFQHVSASQIQSYSIDAIKTLQQLCQVAEVISLNFM